MGTLIAGVKLYDGTGAPGRLADVALSGGVISAVTPPGVCDRTRFRKVIDGAGLSLSPGWIDIHSHSDENYFETPGADSKITQGITTEIGGNCGFSPDEKGDHGGLAAYIKRLAADPPAVNVASFTGFNSLRMQVLGDITRRATETEIARMQEIFAGELKLGSVGLSSGFYYVSGRYATMDEAARVASLLRGTGKPYAAHLRCEGAGLLDGIREVVLIASAGSGSLQISHLKTSGSGNFHLLDEAFRMIEDARRSGMRIHADRYPYTYCSTGLRMMVPEPFAGMDDDVLQETLQNDPGKRQMLEMLLQENPEQWDRVILVDSEFSGHASILGKTLAEIAAGWQCDPASAAVRLLTEARPRAAFGNMSDKNLTRILQQPWVFAGSDAGCRSFGNSKVHPRAFGTMPRFFRLARAAGVPVEEIIRRMTLAPAAKCLLHDRGAVKPGLAADLTLFDENTLDSAADYACADRIASGIAGVWVNGELAWSPDQKTIAARSGKFLRC
ncbi:MAG: amidohydrolase family protein [Lentisphaeria bacterium]|nr:amidohydrolase family protein [Lentisphaeria bacterium]